MLVQGFVFAVGYKDVPKLREIFEDQMGVQLNNLVIDRDGDIEYFETFAWFDEGDSAYGTQIDFDSDTCTIVALYQAHKASANDLLEQLQRSDSKIKIHFSDDQYEYDQEYVNDGEKNLHHLYTSIKAKGHSSDPIARPKDITRWINFLEPTGLRIVYEFELDDMNTITSLQQCLTDNFEALLRGDNRLASSVILSSESDETCLHYMDRLVGGALCLQLRDVFHELLSDVHKHQQK